MKRPLIWDARSEKKVTVPISNHQILVFSLLNFETPPNTLRTPRNYVLRTLFQYCGSKIETLLIRIFPMVLLLEMFGNKSESAPLLNMFFPSNHRHMRLSIRLRQHNKISSNKYDFQNLSFCDFIFEIKEQNSTLLWLVHRVFINDIRIETMKLMFFSCNLGYFTHVYTRV